MKHICSIRLDQRSGEEQLPDFAEDFPYIATRAELGGYEVPWHWHKAAELFVVESGCLEYDTPHGRWRFPAGSGGYLNPNVLHTSRVVSGGEETVQLLHLFAPSLLSGGTGSRLEQKFILPLTTSPLELLPLDREEHEPLLRMVCHVFSLDSDAWDHELAVRQELTEIWRQLLILAQTYLGQRPDGRQADAQIKAMLTYIHRHYREAITVDQLAEAGLVSRRSCFRLFRETLHRSPLEVICAYRLEQARRLLAETDRPVTDIAAACGFDSPGYFARVFAAHGGCTPLQYRRMARS